MVKRKIDELGRVVIPRDYRSALSLDPQTPLAMELVGETIVIRKLSHTCALCGAEISGDAPLELCPACIRRVKSEM